MKATKKMVLRRAGEIGATVSLDGTQVHIDMPKHVVSLAGQGMHYWSWDKAAPGWNAGAVWEEALEWMSVTGECPEKGECEVCDG